MKCVFQEMGDFDIYYVLIIRCVYDFGVIWGFRSVGEELVGRWNLRENLRNSTFINLYTK